MIRSALEHGTALSFVSQRFVLAALICLPILILAKVRLQGLKSWFGPALLLALLNGLGFWTQSVGLETVSSSRAAFLTGLYVVFVPLTLIWFGLGRPSRVDAIGVVIALLGLYLFTDPKVSGWSTGDLWILACAFCFALGINHLQAMFRRGVGGGLEIAFLQIALTGVALMSAWGAFERSELVLSAAWSVPVIYCAVFATVLPLWIQTHYQRQTTPTRVALIFALEPVFAAAIAWVGWGEGLSFRSLIGAGVLMCAVVWMELARDTFSQSRVRGEP